jgi:asparagine synthase (glutamine-hydrolysing)
MSGIAGVYHLDTDQRVSQELLKRMLDCVPHLGPDGARLWVDGFIGLGHRQLCTTEQSLRELQPAANRSGTCWITFDGRVDNREELIRRLTFITGRLEQPTDVDLVLCAYDTWGIACLKWIIGDFAFALWDSRQRQLFCGRDAYGMRPFYYRFNAGTFTFASDCVQLFQDTAICPEIDEEKIAEWFTPCGLFHHGYRDLSKSYFRNISELPHAHYLLVDRSGAKLCRYWDIDPSYTIRYRHNEEYAEHFSDLFREAVRCRLRSCGPVGAELSGGFDSSSVVCVARQLYDSGESKSEGFATFSVAFDELSCDERPLINSITQKYRLESHFIIADRLCGLQNFPPGPNPCLEVNHPHQLWFQEAARALYQLAHERGIRVMLSGEGAERAVMGSSLVLDSLIRHLRLRELYSRLMPERSWRAALSNVVRFGLIPLLPKGISGSLYSKWVRPGRSYFPDWFPARFRQKILQEIVRQAETVKRFPSFLEWGRRVQYETLNPSHPLLRTPFSLPIERRLPYLDRRLVEFCLAIPPERKYEHLPETRKGSLRGRALQRTAFKGVLPEEIRQSLVKVSFNEIYKERFSQHSQSYKTMFAPPAVPLVAELGYLHKDKIWGALSDIFSRSQNLEDVPLIVAHWIHRVTLLEIWLRTLESFKNGTDRPMNLQTRQSNFAKTASAAYRTVMA